MKYNLSIWPSVLKHYESLPEMSFGIGENNKYVIELLYFLIAREKLGLLRSNTFSSSFTVGFGNKQYAIY